MLKIVAKRIICSFYKTSKFDTMISTNTIIVVLISCCYLSKFYFLKGLIGGPMKRRLIGHHQGAMEKPSRGYVIWIRVRGDEGAMEKPSRGYVIWIRVRGDEGAMEKPSRGYVIWIRVRDDEEAMKGRWIGHQEAMLYELG